MFRRGLFSVCRTMSRRNYSTNSPPPPTVSASFTHDHELILDELIQRLSNAPKISEPSTAAMVSQTGNQPRAVLVKDGEPSRAYDVGHFQLANLASQLKAHHMASVALSKVETSESMDLPDYVGEMTTSDLCEVKASEQTRRLVSLHMADARELRQMRARQLMDRFRTRSNDTGRTEVQIAAITARMDRITAHMRSHKKDYGTKRSIYILAQRRRLLLKYLQSQHLERYATVCRVLGFRTPHSKSSIHKHK